MVLLVIMFAIALNISANTLVETDNPPEIKTENGKIPCCVDMRLYFEMENYISDIPFNTKKISAQIKYEEAVNEIYLDEEELYVDDIPFDTKSIAIESGYNKAIQEEFDFEEETYVDDIPFDTDSITQVYFQSHYALSE